MEIAIWASFWISPPLAPSSHVSENIFRIGSPPSSTAAAAGTLHRIIKIKIKKKKNENKHKLWQITIIMIARLDAKRTPRSPLSWDFAILKGSKTGTFTEPPNEYIPHKTGNNCKNGKMGKITAMIKNLYWEKHTDPDWSECVEGLL